MRLFVCLAVSLLLASRPADACKIPHESIFTYMDEAETIVQGQLHARNGMFVLRVSKTFKGKPRKEIPIGIRARGPHSSCSPSLKHHVQGIAYLNADDRFAYAYNSFPRANKELAALITSYLAAKDDKAARATVLVDVIATSKQWRFVYDASLTLSEDAGALAKVTKSDCDRMKAAIDRMSDSRDTWERLAGACSAAS